MLINTKESKILEQLNAAGFEAYFVGGCVRDTIMGRQYKDIDVATNATPEEVIGVFGRENIIETGIKHGTVTVKPYMVEVTTFRSDGEYSDNRRPDSVAFVTSLEEDLKRRDFTINAMAMDRFGNIIDPFDGQVDIKFGIIRAVGNATERFSEDALRIMRAMRFASIFDFHIIMSTEAAMIAQKSLLKNISAERIFSEFCKMITGESATRIIRSNFAVLCEVIPEIKEMRGFEQNNPYHIYDVMEHTLVAMNSIDPSEKNLRMAMLFHDIGKPSCYTEDEKGTGHFYGHPDVSAEITEAILRRFKADNDTIYKVTTLVENHDIELSASRKSVKRRLNKFGQDMFFDLVKIRRADVSAQSEIAYPTSGEFDEIEQIAKEIIAEGQCFSLKDMVVNGKDIMSLGVKEGKAVGVILNELLEMVLSDETDNDREMLLAEAKKIAETII